MSESDPKVVSLERILEDTLAYEIKDRHRLNGYILLIHLGADRKDKLYRLLEPMMKELRSRGYELVRIDEMLRE
ncbi:MAG: hypothetical protein WBQ89_00845 [Candidatus Acidiferrum sp.]